MEPVASKWLKMGFWLAFLYDFVLGIAFLIFPMWVFTTFNTPEPNHLGYVQFAGGLLITFSLMFLQISKNPIANKNLLPYGILLKLTYCGVTGYYWIASQLPDMWKPFTIADLVFLLLFAMAWKQLNGSLGFIDKSVSA